MGKQEKIKAGVVGAAGYTGGELIRLLLHHPATELTYLVSRSNAGKPVASVHPDLTGETSLLFCTANDMLEGLAPDVLFLCLGHGESRQFLETHPIPSRVRIIDLANDFRLLPTAGLGERQFIYGLPELNRDSIRRQHAVANPGCFATAIQLGLLPLAQAGWLKEVYTTGITGSTGAGQSLTATSHFSWRANNIQAYKTLTHQHMGEIRQSLGQLQSKPGIEIHFVPWRGDFTRGIFISSQMKCDHPLEALLQLFEQYYAAHPFTHVTREPVFLKQVVNTNKCFIQLEKTGSQLVVHSVIDNLLKGASGQAVQNMNLLFDLEEETGLRLKAIGF